MKQSTANKVIERMSQQEDFKGIIAELELSQASQDELGISQKEADEFAAYMSRHGDTYALLTGLTADDMSRKMQASRMLRWRYKAFKDPKNIVEIQ